MKSVGAFLILKNCTMKKITAPTLLLDEDLCKSNIKKMADKAKYNNLKFKPHMKTHQSATIGRWLKEAGVEAITVSSITMARYFAENGWNNITIAFPCNIRQIQQINELAKSVTLTLLVNTVKTATLLNEHLTTFVNAYIEIDTGSNRTGIPSANTDEIKKLISVLQSTVNIRWKGFYSHPGHSYQCRSDRQILRVHKSVVNQFDKLKNKIEFDFGPIDICVGDTPCCSVADDFGPINAISPGNFVFYDLMQWQIGSCNVGDIAIAVQCPVVDKYPKRREIAIHGGAIHFSKERLEQDGNKIFGFNTKKAKTGRWQITDKQSYLSKLSQEHGIVQCSKATFDAFVIGDLITILPVHSCLTANLMGEYQLTDGTAIKQM